jgi:hypothetical protein
LFLVGPVEKLCRVGDLNANGLNKIEEKSTVVGGEPVFRKHAPASFLDDSGLGALIPSP